MSIRPHGKRSRARLLAAACLAAAVPGHLLAPDSTGRDVLRRACDEARRTLHSPERTEEVWHAIVEVHVCPSLAGLWDHPPADTTGLRLLGEISTP